MRSSRRRFLRGSGITDRGFVLIVVLGIMTTLVMLVIGFLSLTRLQAEMVLTAADETRAENCAWSGIDWMVANIWSQADPSNTGKIDDSFVASRKDWWYREYKARQHHMADGADEWLYGANNVAEYWWINLEPKYESSWVYFPDHDSASEAYLRFEFHVIDENAFININDWIYDHAPTAGQMANIISNIYVPTILERDYMMAHGMVQRDQSLQRLWSSGHTRNWPNNDSQHGAYRRARLKPVESWLFATAARRARKVNEDRWAGHEGALPQIPTNYPYGFMEGHEISWLGHQHDGRSQEFSVTDQIRYYDLGYGLPWNWDVGWNQAPYPMWDESSRRLTHSLTTRTERVGYQDPDSGCSPINVNSAARSREWEYWSRWDNYYSQNCQHVENSMNVIEGVFPVEALWQLLIVDPSYTGKLGIDVDGDGAPDDDPNTGNGAPGDADSRSRLVISNELLKEFMTNNNVWPDCEEVAGSWDDPDGDGTGMPDPTSLDPSTNMDPQDRRLYKEARQELVERAAWQLAFQYQETMCRFFMATWWDFRLSEDTASWRDNQNQPKGYKVPGAEGKAPSGDLRNPEEAYYQGWFDSYCVDYDYLERYINSADPKKIPVAEAPVRYALMGNSVTGSNMAMRDREDSTRWPGGRANFWTQVTQGMTTMASGSWTNPDYTAAGGPAYLGSNKIGVTLKDAGGFCDWCSGTKEMAFEIKEGKLDRWTAAAVYNSIYPGELSLGGWTFNTFSPAGGAINVSNPLRVLSDNEDDGCFDIKFKRNWHFDYSSAFVTGSTWAREYHGWRGDNSYTAQGSSFGIRFPAADFKNYQKFGIHSPHQVVSAFKRVYDNHYHSYVHDPIHGKGHPMKCYYPPRNMYHFYYGTLKDYQGNNWIGEQPPPGMLPRSIKKSFANCELSAAAPPGGGNQCPGAGAKCTYHTYDDGWRRQYWRKQFTPNTFATELTNTSTHFRFVVTAQMVDVNNVADVDDDRIYYERNIAGFVELAPDVKNEDMGPAYESAAVVPNIPREPIYGEWYRGDNRDGERIGFGAYWRKRLNFDGLRLHDDDHYDSGRNTGHGFYSSDLPHWDAFRRFGADSDPRYRRVAGARLPYIPTNGVVEAPFGAHDRWYDYRGWKPEYYDDTDTQIRKRIQFIHFVDNNMK